jgi:predicted  nucleic acid-binding Zn-ribbon protein
MADEEDRAVLRAEATEHGRLRIKYDQLRKAYGDLQVKNEDITKKLGNLSIEHAALRDSYYTLHDLIDEVSMKARQLTQA